MSRFTLFPNPEKTKTAQRGKKRIGTARAAAVDQSEKHSQSQSTTRLILFKSCRVPQNSAPILGGCSANFALLAVYCDLPNWALARECHAVSTAVDETLFMGFSPLFLDTVYARIQAMRKTFKYRLFPTRAQETILDAQLDECRWLYNHFLEVRKTSYEATKTAPGLYDQQKTIAALKTERPTLGAVHSQVLQNVAVRIDLAFKAFFRRVKVGEKPGYPRFRGKFRYDSMTFPQCPSGCSVNGDRLTLSKVGSIRIVLHRPIEGTPKTCTVRRTSTGKWYVCFSCEVVRPDPLPASTTQVGIDVGLTTFATLSVGPDGEPIDNPRFFRTDQAELAKVQRKFAKTAKGTAERRKRRKPVARIHERIANRRHNFAHQAARRIVNRFGFIAIEDLEVNRMVHNHCLAKSISDAAWSMFFALLIFKAANAGRSLVKVNPAYTSQTCNACGHRQKMPLSERIYRCGCCHVERGRDHNASLNILALGLQGVGGNSVEATSL